MPEQLLDINGTRLFVDERGDAGAPPLLFIHGGPGQSCFDFGAFQAEHLAKDLRVVAVDQRGLLRSDPLPEGYPITVDELIADYEAIREALGIEAWTIAGHSAGGHVALRYAHRHPEHVTGAVFDCPAFDCDLTDRYRLPKAAELLDEVGEHATAEEVRALAALERRLTAEDEVYVPMQRLGARYNELFFHTQESIDAYNAAHAASGFTGEQWRRGMSHRPLIAEMYRPLFDLLPQLTRPSLLVHGRYDLVAAPAVVDAYREKAVRGRVHTFEDSAHFAYIEEPEAYAAVVSAFASDVHAGRDPHA